MVHWQKSMLQRHHILQKELLALLKNFGLEKVKKITPFPTSGNIAYKIETSKGKYFLRLCPDGQRWRSKGEIQAEIELLEYLKKRRFPVSEPICAKNGKKIISLGNRHGYLRKFIEGKEKLHPMREEIKKLGKILGTFHTLTENYKTAHKRKHVWDLNQTKKYFKEDRKIILKSNFKDKKKFVHLVEQELSKLHFPQNLPSGTIHEDLGKRHVIWNRGKIVSVIDFDRAYYGKLVLDLGQAARGWCFKNNWKSWSNENLKALLQGYESKRRLTLLEKKYLQDAIKFAILERAISFALRYAHTTHDVKDEKFALDSLSTLLSLINRNEAAIGEIIV